MFAKRPTNEAKHPANQRIYECNVSRLYIFLISYHDIGGGGDIIGVGYRKVFLCIDTTNGFFYLYLRITDIGRKRYILEPLFLPPEKIISCTRMQCPISKAFVWSNMPILRINSIALSLYFQNGSLLQVPIIYFSSYKVLKPKRIQ